MRRFAETWRRLRAWWQGAALDRRLAEEIAFHVDRQAEKNRQAGMTAAESRRRALLMFGDLEGTKERARDEARPARTDATLRDLRYAIRAWRRTPGFTLIALLTMTLGIGATTAVFTIVNGVLLTPLPYPAADRLVDLRHTAPGLDLPAGTLSTSATQLFSYREHTRVFETIGLWTQGAATIAGQGDLEDVRDGGLHEPAPATVYWPALMTNFSRAPVRVARSMAFVLRTDRAGTESLLAEIRQAVRAVNGGVPVADARRLSDIYAEGLEATSITLSLLGLAAAMALLLSLVGIYGVLSYAVARRTREIGIRSALGAGPAALRAGFVGDGLRLTAIGLACGLAAALVLTRSMDALLVGVSALDPMTYLATALVLIAAAAAASYLPAHRATAVSPVGVLRAP